MTEPADLHYQRALRLSEIERWREAIKEAQKCLSIEPNHYRAFCMISRCYLAVEDYPKSLEFAERAIASNPHQEWAYRLQTHVFRKKKKFKKALKSAEECVKADSQGIYPLNNLAGVQLDLKKVNNAAKTAELMRSISPDSFETHEMMGYVALHKSKIKDALVHFERALKISPESAETLGIYAWTLYAKAEKTGAGRKKRELLKNAIDVFELSLQVNPNSVSTKANLKRAIDVYLITDQISVITILSMGLIGMTFLLFHKLNIEVPAAVNILQKSPDLIFVNILMLIEIHVLGFIIGGNRAVQTLPPKSRIFIESQSQTIYKLPFLVGQTHHF
jgi:tetratricopeptide (TPR) repeat protein